LTKSVIPALGAFLNNVTCIARFQSQCFCYQPGIAIVWLFIQCVTPSPKAGYRNVIHRGLRLSAFAFSPSTWKDDPRPGNLAYGRDSPFYCYSFPASALPIFLHMSLPVMLQIGLICFPTHDNYTRVAASVQRFLGSSSRRRDTSTSELSRTPLNTVSKPTSLAVLEVFRPSTT